MLKKQEIIARKQKNATKPKNNVKKPKNPDLHFGEILFFSLKKLSYRGLSWTRRSKEDTRRIEINPENQELGLKNREQKKKKNYSRKHTYLRLNNKNCRAI